MSVHVTPWVAVQVCARPLQRLRLRWQAVVLPCQPRSGHSRCLAAHAGKRKQGKGKKEEGAYSPTVNLPKTDFNIRAMSKVKEPEIQKFWEQNDIYKTLSEQGAGETYTLHDGPPYANGDLHCGHAMNKILKDFVNRRKLLEGRKAKFVPGWDTHGLPIELKVLQTLSKEERMQSTPLELRRKARDFALETVKSQCAGFKRFGVWADWDAPYVTLQPEFEAAQLGVFGKMVLNGHIYRGRKPVHWSPSSRTALAEAELEYPEGHKSKSIYVSLPICSVPEGASRELRDALEGAALAVWTTTPWTIPANMAVAVNEELHYSVVQLPEGACDWLACRKLVVATDLVATIAGKLKLDDASSLTPLATASGAALEGCRYRHPLFERESPLVIGGDYITTDAGTGLVHTAPGHGQEDYLVGLRCGLDVLSPVDDAGVFTAEAGQFEGQAVLGEGNAAVIEALKGAGALLRLEDYRHKYPYDWRTKKPTIFRATDQWFASVDGFKAAALAAIEEVTWMPSVGKNRIRAMTDGRSDWCISRQRAWGVPIPVFYDKATQEPLMTPETIAHVQEIVAQYGSDAWWSMEVAKLLPEHLREQAESLVKGTDTMDVWFDSGSSWAGVAQQRDGLRYPADLYLEGSDQHRGWFQSSLLTSVATNGHAPYKAVLTHGFVLDEKGAKMSKSLGNVVDPLLVIEGGANEKQQPAYGADVLRLWVASVDYSVDVAIGPSILKQVFEAYRKLRGTLRFILGNVHDFDPAAHAVTHAALPLMDRHMLHSYRALLATADDAYGGFNFGALYRALNVFLAVDLSSRYFELAKDRLYIRDVAAPQRRACQTVLHEMLRGLLAVMAPVTPHMCEDAWRHLAFPADKHASVFQAGLPAAREEWALDEEELSTVEGVFAVKDVALKALEQARAEKLIGAPLDAHVKVYVSDDATRARLAALNASDNGVDALKWLFITSQVTVVEEVAQAAGAHVVCETTPVGEVTAAVVRADGTRCERCWHYSSHVGECAEHPQLCERCAPLVQELGFEAPATAPVPEPAAAA